MKKKLLYNTVSSLLFQILTIICGFVLPRLFIGEYGSEINGVVSSITQFLSIISFLELGVGAVIQSSLYKPLSQNDIYEISTIQVAGNRFFRKIAYVLVLYIAVLTIVYPFIANQGYGWAFTAMLILAISISSFAQYYFGIVDRILLVADQRGYIAYNSQIITLIANTIACILLIKSGASIHLVKLTTSIIYLARPLAIRLYINSHYKIDWKVQIKEDPIKQKWDAVTQHIAYIILNDTDTIVLTLLSTLSNVSIYSVYYMVVNGIKTLFLSMTNGFQSIMGEMWAKQEFNKLTDFFSMVEYTLHTIIVLIFTVTAMLIIPFISVYTNRIADVNYIQPTFAVLLITAYALHCLSTPYHIMIKAAGHFKQTSICYIIAATLNILISVVTVRCFGLTGVALGTLSAMLFQTVWLACYNSKNLIKVPMIIFIKRCAIDVACAGLIVFVTHKIKLNDLSFTSWVLMAFKVFCMATLSTIVLNLIVCYKDIKSVVFFIKNK